MQAKLLQDSLFCTDSGLERLTAQHPVRQVVGTWYDVLRGYYPLSPNYGASVFKKSPTDDRTAEILFGDLARAAARRDAWVGHYVWCERVTDEGHVLRINGKHQVRNADSIEKAADAGLLRIVRLGNEIYAAPTEGLVGYMATKFNELPIFLERRGPTIILTRMQYEVLKAAIRPEYEGSVPKGVSELLPLKKGRKPSLATVRNHIVAIFERCGTGDFFCTAYRALYNGDIGIDHISGEMLDYLSSGITLLSPRERDVLAAFGKTALSKKKVEIKDIAQKLAVTHDTARNHVHNIYAKLGLNNRAQLALAAYMLNERTRILS